MAMTHTYEELKKKTIAELREIAKEIQHEAVQGYTQLNKEHLLPAVCKALGIDTHAHHAAALAEKAAVKAKMREINAKKATAVESGDHELLRQLRRQYHRLNHTLRTAAKHSPES
jgi:DNA-binding IclR family transcriptional regulator